MIKVALWTPVILDIVVIAQFTLLVGVCLGLAAWVFERLLPGPPPNATRAVSLRSAPALRIFALVNAALMAICYVALFFWRTRRPWFPYASPYLPFYRFWDLIVYQYRMPYLHTAQFFKPEITFPWQYPPAIALLYVPLEITHHAAMLFFAIVIPCMLLLAFGLARRLYREGLRKATAYALVIGALLLSYPLWFELDLGNMEIFIFLFIAFALLAWSKGKGYGAAVLLGLATGMKLFPGVYFALFLRSKQYKQIAVGLVTAVLSNACGLWLICPDMKLAWHEVQAGLAYNRQYYMLTRLPEETGVDHSIFGLIKVIADKITHNAHMPSALLTGYMVFAAVTGLALYFLRIRKMPVVNEIAALCIASVLLPPTSHDYTLLHLYIVLAMFAVLAVRAHVAGYLFPGMTAAMACLGILFSSQSEFIYHGISVSGQIKCLTLITLFYIILRYPISNSFPKTGQRPG